ncbi:MAG: hypothetical protein WC670_07870 [Pseudolabrys sp.]|jgi:hypothetical protein
MRAAEKAAVPPSEVTLLYRNLGMTHVFIAEEFRGFHVGGTTLRGALNTAIHALGTHVTLLFKLDAPVSYRLEGTPAEFEDRLHDSNKPMNFSVRATMTKELAHAH